MAKLKYNPLYEALRNKHYGFTFQTNHYGESMFAASKNARARYPNQHQRQQNLQKAIRHWRDMVPATKTNWEDFAAAYPQPSKKDATNFLTGYQLFLKRNHYIFLNEGINADFMEDPYMENLDTPVPTVNLDTGNNCIDVTEEYIKNFGILPVPGQFVLFVAIPYSSRSGQFFAPIIQTLEVEAIYIDGFFLNLTLPATVENITFSIYLSKPVHESVTYAGTKIRYMGCFGTKVFLGLTDTPDSYAGQGGKTVAVNVAENALEFIAGGGGGLTCEDLAACPAIILINSQIQTLAEIAAANGETSVPAVNFGTLYNAYCFRDGYQIAPAGWHIPHLDEWNLMISTYGGTHIAGGKFNEPNLNYWTSIAPGTTNLTNLNFRANGTRYGATGIFTNLKSSSYIWSSKLSSVGNRYFFIQTYYNNLTINSGLIYYFHYACGIRYAKDTTTLSEGQFGFCIGNDGKIYRTVCVAGIEVTADNVNETKLNDGSDIPIITDGATFGAATTPARCFYNNDTNNG